MLPSLFGRKQEVNLKLCRQTKDQLQRLIANTDQRRQQQLEEDAAKSLAQMKVTLQGTQGEKQPSISLLYPHADTQQMQMQTQKHNTISSPTS